MHKEILEDTHKVLKNQSHPLWMLLPDFGNGLVSAQNKILAQMKKQDYGKAVAPLLEKSIAIQGPIIAKTVRARNKMRDGSGTLVEAYLKTLDDILDKKDGNKTSN